MLILINPYNYLNKKNIVYNKNYYNISNNIINIIFNCKLDNNTIYYILLNTIYNPSTIKNKLYTEKSLYFNGFTNYVKLISKSANSFCKLLYNIVIMPNKKNAKQYILYCKNQISIFIDEKNKLCVKLLTSSNNKQKYSYFISNNDLLFYNWNILTIQYINNNIVVYINNCNISGIIKKGFDFDNLCLNNIIIGMKNNKYYFNGFINKFDIQFNASIDDNIHQNIIEYMHPYSNWISTHSDPNNLVQYDLFGKIDGKIYKNVKNLQFGEYNQYIAFTSDILANLQEHSFSIYLKYFINKEIIQNQNYILISTIIYSRSNGFSITLETKNNLQYIVCEIRLLCKRYIIKSPVSYELNKCNNVILTYNGDNCMQLHQNYNIVKTLTKLKNGKQNNITLNTYIGGYNNYKSFPGIIDDIKIFKRLLIDTERCSLLNN